MPPTQDPAPPRDPPDLLVFDCDGVLVDSEVLAVDVFCEVLVAAGVPAVPAMIARCFGMKQADIIASVARDTGRPVPASVADDLWPATRRRFGTSLKPMPGVVRFLERLADRPRCVASSSSLERIRFSLAVTGLDRFFGDRVFSSQQVARGKPAPDLFLFAADRMGVAPARCVVIEDSVFGVEGARAANMRALGFTGGSHVGPDHGPRLLARGAEDAFGTFDAVERRLFGTALG